MKYMSQHLFEWCAFLSMVNYLNDRYSLDLGLEEDFGRILGRLAYTYLSSYPGDRFENLLPEACERLDRITSETWKNPLTRVEIFDSVRKYSETTKPNGEPRKKFLGFFGGTKLQKSHPEPEKRVDKCMTNFVCYLVLMGYWSPPEQHAKE